MRRSRTAHAAFVGALLAGLLLPIAAAPAFARDPAAAQQERTIAYWTAERIANAKPRDYVKTPAGHLVPKAKPQKPGGGGTTSVIGASWTKGGQVLQTTGK